MAIALLTLALVGTLSLLATILLGYRAAFDVALVRWHFIAALLTTTVLVAAHSFIMFFLIATGVSLKEMEQERGWGDEFRRRTVALKGRAFPLLSGTLLLVMANFILGAAAHTQVIPGWAHGTIAWATFAACAATLQREWAVLGENNRLIAEAGERRSRARG